MDIIQKIKKSGLTGRGGAGFPTAIKWEAVKNSEGQKKYVVCNASEGEPGIKKDGYLFDKFPEKIIAGMNIAIDFLNAEKGYIYLKPEYYKKYQAKLTKLIIGTKIELFRKPEEAGYIGGEETSALNCLEGKRIEPRLRPPFPTTNGLWNCPTLINNVETFYAVSLINDNKYENKRLYTLNGDTLWTGVYELPESWTIEQVLKETNNFPNFDFFVQVGGDASGEVLNGTQLDKPIGGGASITIYSILKHQPLDLFKYWINFFMMQSCGQCTPCREGTYRLNEIINSKSPDWNLIKDLLVDLSDSSFCALGASVPVPINSFIANALPLYKIV
jgi:NADH:ubiquinone oxidoreductase subunit F (NADH-binding)